MFYKNFIQNVIKWLVRHTIPFGFFFIVVREKQILGKTN